MWDYINLIWKIYIIHPPSNLKWKLEFGKKNNWFYFLDTHFFFSRERFGWIRTTNLVWDQLGFLLMDYDGLLMKRNEIWCNMKHNLNLSLDRAKSGVKRNQNQARSQFGEVDIRRRWTAYMTEMVVVGSGYGEVTKDSNGWWWVGTVATAAVACDNGWQCVRKQTRLAQLGQLWIV